MVREQHDNFEQNFLLQQVVAGTPGGLSLLVMGVRLLLEVNPGFIVVKTILRNTYNEVKRAAVLRALQASPFLRG